jgi:DNA replication protein DnaC
MSEAKTHKETAYCDKHESNFEQTITKAEVFEGKVISFRSGCPKCIEENALESKRKDDAELAGRIASDRERMGIPDRLAGTTFDRYRTTTAEQNHAKKRFIDLASGSFNIIATGNVGTGKTMLSCCLLEEIRGKRSGKIIRLIELIRILKETWRRDSHQNERDVIRSFVDLDILIIDEVGIQFGSETEALFLFDIINGRYDKMRPTVMLSNLGIDALKKVLGERIIDRMRDDGGILLQFNWDSERGRK